MKKIVGTAIAMLASVSGAGMALAEYPERPVSIVEPWPPGDVDDQLLRVIAEEFTKETGVPAKVINRPGGFGLEGAASVLSSPADGYTIGSFLIDIPTSYLILGIAPYAKEDMEVIGLNMNSPSCWPHARMRPTTTLPSLRNTPRATRSASAISVSRRFRRNRLSKRRASWGSSSAPRPDMMLRTAPR